MAHYLHGASEGLRHSCCERYVHRPRLGHSPHVPSRSATFGVSMPDPKLMNLADRRWKIGLTTDFEPVLPIQDIDSLAELSWLDIPQSNERLFDGL